MSLLPIEDPRLRALISGEMPFNPLIPRGEQNPKLGFGGGGFGGILKGIGDFARSPVGQGLTYGLLSGNPGQGLAQYMQQNQLNQFRRQQFEAQQKQQEIENEFRRRQLERQSKFDDSRQAQLDRQQSDFDRQEAFRGMLGETYDDEGNLDQSRLALLRQKFPLLSANIGRPQQQKFGQPKQGTINGEEGFFVTDQNGNVKILEGISGKKKFTQDNLKSASFANRAIAASDGYESLTDVSPSKTNSFIPDFMLDENTVRARQFKTDFVTAILRPESGATITEEEYDREIVKYFPKAGDTQQIKQQKAQARKRAIDGLIKQSEGAFKKNFGQQQNTVSSNSRESPTDKQIARAKLDQIKPENKNPENDISGSITGSLLKTNPMLGLLSQGYDLLSDN